MIIAEFENREEQMKSAVCNFSPEGFAVKYTVLLECMESKQCLPYQTRFDDLDAAIAKAKQLVNLHDEVKVN